MDNFIIKQCECNEIVQLMEFFKTNWSDSHLISTNREFVDYQFYNKRKHSYNFLLAKDEQEKIIGMLGYIPNYHYDGDIRNVFVFITNWLVLKNSGGVGLKLLNAVKSFESTNSYGTVNNNDLTVPMYKALKYKTGVLEQYVFINNNVTNFKILKGNIKSDVESNFIAEVIPVQNINELKISGNLHKFIAEGTPNKTLRYLENKYLKSPYYKYKLYAVCKACYAEAILVVKKVAANNAFAFRIIDYLGEPEFLKGINNFCRKLLMEENAEYIDFYCMGDFGGILLNEGFILNEGQNGLIVPNYFDKFLQENITSNYAYFTEKPFYIFRGDCDAERPRIIIKKDDDNA